MIIITAKDKEFKYIGNISIYKGEKLIIITSEFRDGNWTGNSYDGFFYEDVKSIVGVDNKETT